MRKEGRLLTATELELMNNIWRIKLRSVRDVMVHLQKERNLA